MGYYEEFEDENFVDIHFMSKDRQHVREVDEAFSALADRINKGGDEELKRLLRVIEAYLEGGDEEDK